MIPAQIRSNPCSLESSSSQIEESHALVLNKVCDFFRSDIFPQERHNHNNWGETLVPESTFEHKIGDAEFATSCVQMLVTVSEPALMQWKLL